MSIKTRIRMLERSGAGGVNHVISSVPTSHPEFPGTDCQPVTVDEWVAKYCEQPSAEAETKSRKAR
ncbi:hypothetical protein [Roseovarius atlanticus]|uniref:hypothetical protein n=1 Tax=Roseovarius atlanticus TaxID=1641875 RepID=UPI001C93B4D7|nr:hypothetical protein [Roseovarius atlanticus]MBY5987094.1 hypothetical protein [Roseovarius atlanticus]MBY6125734.1 hypothetical protein [Roseovarius atlanticus]MBY6149805.1 hypothetical protein [Roseovarius atlanticus]